MCKVNIQMNIHSKAMCAHIEMSPRKELFVTSKLWIYLPFKTSPRGGLQEKSVRSSSGIFTGD